jgi:TrpR-related protein YerC/YecD
MSTWDSPDTDALIAALLSLKDATEAKNFLRDLLTERELIEFSSRWKTAQLLDAGVSYSQIEKETGLSSATIARISKWLTEGRGGYKAVIVRLHHHSAQVDRLAED